MVVLGIYMLTVKYSLRLHILIITILALICAMPFGISNAYAFPDERFKNPTDKGNTGENLTQAEMEKRGYKSLPSKYSGNQGIDHVFIKYNPDGDISDIIVAETKAHDGSPDSNYNQKQMSDEGIDDRIKKMKNSKDPEVKKAGELLEKNRDKIRKEYWHHNTRTHKATVYEVGPDGNLKSVKAEYNTERALRKLLKAKEKQQKILNKKVINQSKKLFKNSDVRKLSENPKNLRDYERIIIKGNKEGYIVKPGILLPDGRLVMSLKGGGFAGLVVIATESSIAGYQYINGDIFKPDFEKELCDAAVKGAAVGAGTGVAIILCASSTPPGIIILGIATGAYFIADTCLSVWHENSDAKFLNREDLKLFGIEIDSVLNVKIDPSIPLNDRN